MRVEVARRTPEQGPGTMLFPQCASRSSLGPSSSSASSTISGPPGSSSTSVFGSTSKTPTPIPIWNIVQERDHRCRRRRWYSSNLPPCGGAVILSATVSFISIVRRVAYARVRRWRCIHRIQPTDGVAHIFSSIVQLNLSAATQAHAYPGRLTV